MRIRRRIRNPARRFAGGREDKGRSRETGGRQDIPFNLPYAAALVIGLLAVIGQEPDRARHAGIHVIDGDTLEIDGERLRLLGVDTPELDGRCQAEIRLARAAKQETRRRIEQAIRAGTLEIRRSGRTDRYGRTLARVDVSGENLADVLVEAGLGRRYEGGNMLAQIRGTSWSVDWCGGAAGPAS